MNRTILGTLPIVSLLLALTVFADGQVATGVPKFSSIGGGEFDTVNLGNLNVHFTVPVLTKLDEEFRLASI
jgi:hypothetical protein